MVKVAYKLLSQKKKEETHRIYAIGYEIQFLTFLNYAKTEIVNYAIHFL
jgi:hypothetical protein